MRYQLQLGRVKYNSMKRKWEMGGRYLAGARVGIPWCFECFGCGVDAVAMLEGVMLV